MNMSFLANIAFTILVIVGAFLANLVVLVFTNSQWHVSGVLLAIVAAAASYWAQHNYTAAAIAEQQLLVTPGLTAYQGIADKAEGFGQVFQLVAIACLVGPAACFWLGMR